ncbi:hypothetical protein DEO72_LG11g2132 [Vigna unguiculata]|uniref:Uncharacterized protein n=1 Tax=Vigna unguiculata TaxID=3917 RepID=A0A4D6NR45_VIGUN|nr:hypothetical protein DEO72_LG11g2132 [Vigna unguiculata]
MKSGKAGTQGTWWQGVFRQATPARTMASEALVVWRHVSPARRSRSVVCLATLGQRQAILLRQRCFARFDVRDLQCFSDTLKVSLLVFIELWLRTYPLSYGLG